LSRRWLATLVIPFVLAVFASSASAALTADYKFNGNFKNSHGPAKALTEADGSGIIKNSDVNGDPDQVWEWSAGTGLKLAKAGEALGNQGNTYTFVMLVRLEQVDSYRKLVDFRDLDVDYGWYVYSQSLYPYDLDNFDHSIQRIPGGQWRQIVLTRNKEGIVRGYVGGKELGHDKDKHNKETLGSDKVLHFLMNDTHQMPGQEETGGQIARLRIYDDALSAKKIKRLGH
jgi:hypothetical protein